LIAFRGSKLINVLGSVELHVAFHISPDHPKFIFTAVTELMRLKYMYISLKKFLNK